MKVGFEIDKVLSGHQGAVYAVRVSPDGRTLYSGSGDSIVGSWDLDTGAFVRAEARSSSPVYCIELDRSGKQLIIGESNGNIHFMDLEERKVLRSMEAHKKEVFSLFHLASNDVYLSGGGDGVLNKYDSNTFDLLKRVRISGKSIRSIAFDPDSGLLALGCSDHKIYLHDPGSLKRLGILNGHANSVFSVCFRDSSALYSGSRDAHIFQWTKEKDAWKVLNKVPAHYETINALSMSPDRRYLASGSRDGSVKIWEAETLRLLKVLDNSKTEAAHAHSVNTVVWTDENTIASAGDDKKIVIWKLEFGL